MSQGELTRPGLYGSLTVCVAMVFTADFKLGHYMKLVSSLIDI